MDLKFEILKYSQKSTCKDMQERKGFFMFPYYNYIYDAIAKIIDNLKSASNLNGNLNCSKELEHYAS